MGNNEKYLETQNLLVDYRGIVTIERKKDVYFCGNFYLKGKYEDSNFIVSEYATTSVHVKENFILGDITVTNIGKICRFDDDCRYFYGQTVIFIINSPLEIFEFPKAVYLCKKVIFDICCRQTAMEIDNKNYRGQIEIVSDIFFPLLATKPNRLSFRNHHVENHQFDDVNL